MNPKPLDRWDYIALATAALALFVAFGDRIPGLVESKIDTVFAVYESEGGSLPGYVDSALRTLRAQGYTASQFDDDVLTGTGEQPRQLLAAIVAARTVGLPALVLVSGDTVVSAQPLPGSAEAILKAAGVQ